MSQNQQIPATSDIVVLGGGPAGACFASIVKKYAPDVRVTLLEKARFPRWHIGESTIPVVNSVLRDLGIYERLYEGEAVKKIGITFIWGADRKPWNAEYLVLGQDGSEGVTGIGTGAGAHGDELAGEVIDVIGQDLGSLRRGPQKEPFTAFNVRRDEFDKMLLDQARVFGTDVYEGTRAVRVRDRADGPGAGSKTVQWVRDDGTEGIIETDFVLDASGLSALMTRGKRQRDPNMNNFAVYGYLANAGWKVTYNGTRERTTLFVATIPKGWIWYFPVGDDVMSVGVVTHREHFRDGLAKVELEEFFWDMLSDCPEIAALTKDASLRADILPGGARVGAVQDWSSWAEQPVGEGWATAGDAAMFVDPILASGVTLALQSGHRAAYTYVTARARHDIDKAALWGAYGDYLRAEAGSFLTLARFFYGNNRAAESWWWEAHRLVNADGRLDIDPRRSFTMAMAGFFPVPRAIALEVVGPLISGAVGSDADLRFVHENSGVPDVDAVAEMDMNVLTEFHLGLRTEPGRDLPPGQLRVFHDLVTQDPAFFHRLAVSPTDISPALAPIVDAMPRYRTVKEFMDAAPRLVAPGVASEDTLRHMAVQIVRAAAAKGFVALS